MLYQEGIEILGKDGRRRRALKNEIPRDGDIIHFGTISDAMNHVMSMTDSAAAAEPKPQPDHTIRDAHGTASGNRPGYAFAANDVPLRTAAVQAYVERCQRLADAWRHRDQPEPKLVASDQIGHLPARTDAAGHTSNTDAEQAWQDKKQRLEQAWRRHRA